MSYADDDADYVKLPSWVSDFLEPEPGNDPGPVVDDEPDAEIDFDMLHRQRWGVEAQEEE
jgi:hypothetical protein